MKRLLLLTGQLFIYYVVTIIKNNKLVAEVNGYYG